MMKKYLQIRKTWFAERLFYFPIFIFHVSYFLFFSSCSIQKSVVVSKQNTIEAAARALTGNPQLSTANIGICIYDVSSKKYLYDHNGDKYFIPASNTKIATCYAAMKYLGDSLKGIKYSINRDTVFIEPTGDPTFLHPDFKNQPVYDFLEKYSYVKIINPSFTETYFGKGWSWDDYPYNYAAERSNLPVYGNLITISMADNRIKFQPGNFDFEIKANANLDSGFDFEKKFYENKILVTGGDNQSFQIPFTPYLNDIINILHDTLHNTITAEADNVSHPDAVIYSQPTDSVLKKMMYRSDNFYAEQCLLMVSNELLGFMNDEKIIDTFLHSDFENLPQKPRWVDGCGLSRYDLFTPQDLVWILDKIQTGFSWDRITGIFPSAGEGTLSGYYKNFHGNIFAKSGSLSNNIALSGYIITQKNKTLIFSVMVGNHMDNAADVRKSIETFLISVIENN